MKTLLFKLLSFLICILCLNNVLAQSIELNVDEVIIQIPYPTGFHEISKIAPEAMQFAERGTPESNRLLAVFVSESDVGKILNNEDLLYEKYMMIQVYRDLESVNISESDFDQFIADFKENQQTLFNNLAEMTEPESERLKEYVSEKHNQIVDFDIGQSIPLGSVIDSDNVYSIAAFIKTQISIEDYAMDFVMASVSNFIRVKNKLLFVYVFSLYNTQKDLEWARTTSKEWTDSILVLNPNKSTNIDSNKSKNGKSKSIKWGFYIAIGIIIFILGKRKLSH